jgi:hypothetical protein
MAKRKAREAEDERTFEVTVWDMTNGDIVKKRWDATSAEVAEIEEEFRDEPFREVKVEER